jgi:hypothetical protein
MFGLFNRGARRARRLRERGVPTRALVVDARPGDEGRWRVTLLVEPVGANSFTAEVDTAVPAGQQPARGGEAQVLHEPGTDGPVLLTGPVPTEGAGGWSPGLHPAGPLGAPGGLGADDAQTYTHTQITVNGVPVDPADITGAVPPGMSPDRLRDLAATDPAGVAQEILRALAAGELTGAEVHVTEPVELTGDAARQMIEGLAAAGLLTPEQLRQIRDNMP